MAHTVAIEVTTSEQPDGVVAYEADVAKRAIHVIHFP
jgi:hypothetical protein